MNRRSRPNRLGRAAFSAREARRVVLFGAVFAIVAVITLLWPIVFPDLPERVVTVYWTHECDCVAPWVAQLRKAGFIVHDFEQDGLGVQRSRMQVPRRLHGCHLGSYMGYFLEGHVTPEALKRLASERPAAEGIAYARPAAGRDDILYTIHAGQLTPWPSL